MRAGPVHLKPANLQPMALLHLLSKQEARRLILLYMSVMSLWIIQVPFKVGFMSQAFNLDNGPWMDHEQSFTGLQSDKNIA